MDSIERVEIAPGAWILRDFVTRHAESLLMTIQLISDKSPFRSVVTPTGKSMSVEMTNCGDYGWVSDRRGYRYVEIDPVTGTPWPAMPHTLVDLAALAASEAGYWGFRPDVCLINRYVPGSSMGMHQDRDERDFLQPIVSVSLGLSIRFRMSGTRRGGKTASTMLHHGDVVVFGGPARLAFHGVAKLRSGFHPLTGATRINLTFRSAL